MPHGIINNIDGVAEYELTKKRPEILQAPTINRSAILFYNAKPSIGLSDEYVTRENIMWVVFLSCAIIETTHRQDFVNVNSHYWDRYV